MTGRPADGGADGDDVDVDGDVGHDGHDAEPWDRARHGVHGVPPCRQCRAAMTRVGGRQGLQLWSDHWRCGACGWELHVSYGRGSV